MKQKKMLVVTNRFYPQIGGAELNIFYQALALSRYFQVEVVTPRREAGDKVYEKVGNLQIWRLWNLYNPQNRFPYLSGKTFCPRIMGHLLSQNYSLIHCFPAVNPNTMLAVCLAKFKRIPIFLTNFDLFDYQELMAHQHWTWERLDELVLSRKQRLILSQFRAIFTISRRENQWIRAVNPRTFLSKVPILLEEFNVSFPPKIQKGVLEKFQINPEIPLILCLSRISFIKGQDRLIRALPLLKKKTDRFLVVIAGRFDYDLEYYTVLREEVERNQLQSHVLFTGSLLREEVRIFLQICRFHVLPMRFMNSGAVVIETWAAQKAVLQSKQVDPNYVEEGKNGWTFKGEEPEELAEKLWYGLEHPEECKQMGMAGRRLVEKEFQYDSLILQYLQEYSRSSKKKELLF
jgi:glycosyltransferase involved in cell wall biosynthesis